MFKKIDSFMNNLSRWLSTVAEIWIFVMMIIICTDVLSRGFFNRPIEGIPEIVQNSLASIAFLMLPYATYLGQHVRSTMIKDKIPEKGSCILEIISYAIGALLFLSIIYANWDSMIWATKIKDFQGEGLRVPIYPVWWIISVGAFFSAYQCFSKVLQVIALMRGEKVDVKLSEDGGIQI